MAAVISDKLYVTVQFRADTNNDDGLLGFASPYTADAAFAKRKSTQDSWAYGYGATVTIEDDDNVHLELSSTSKIDAASAFIGGWHPRIVKNEPIEGFEIAKNVRRYGWSGSGNVVWRISDPRGFDLEISSDNFASIISCVDMEKGVIKGKCVWGREGAKNILLPEASEPFQEALVRTKKVNSKVSLKDVKIGNTVDVLSTKISDEESVSIYYGKMYFLSSARGITEVDLGYDRTRKVENGVHSMTDVAEHYVFKSVKTNKFFLISSPKISTVISTATMTASQAEDDVNAAIADSDELSKFILASATKIKPDDVTMVLAPVTVDVSNWPLRDNYYSATYIAQYQGSHHVAYYSNKYDRQRGNPTLDLYLSHIDYDQKTVEFDTKITKTTGYSYWGSGVSVNYTKVTSPPWSEVEFFELQVTANGRTAPALHIR